MNNRIKILIIVIVVFGLASWLWTSENPTAKAPTTPVSTHITPIAPPTPQISPTAASVVADSRLPILQNWLDSHNCADRGLAAQYLAAADAHALDWRLLPALSFKEETCVRNAKMNNLWGWASGAKKFDSLESGLNFISSQLDTGAYYAGKTLKQKLYSYNSHPGYYESVLSIMDQISKDKS
jgi:hypothetical protein